MLHPVSIVAIREVLSGVRAAALLARFRGVHGARGLSQQVLQLQGLHQVTVPDEAAVRGLNVPDLAHHLTHLRHGKVGQGR